MQAVIEVVPPPSIAQRTRLPKIVYPDLSEETKEPKNKLESELWACSAKDDSFVVAYVSKMFAVQKKQLPEYKEKLRREESGKDEEQNDGESESDEVLLGFARIYSGKIKAKSRIAAILPKYDTSAPPSHPKNRKYIKFIHVEALYTMMGRDLLPVKEVPAGNVFAVAGLDGFVGRSATLCSPSTLGLSDELAESEIDGKPDVECIINLGKVHAQVRKPHPPDSC